MLIAGGVIQNFHLYDQVVTTLSGAQQTLPGGPVASQEAIKELGTNGGGFYNANSAHPFENPTRLTNWIEIFLLLAISFSLPRTFGRMVDSKKQGYAIAAVMGVLATVSWTLSMWMQLQHHGTVATAVGTTMEGVEQRFGVADSSVFAASTTLTSTGAVDSAHDSYTSLGGLIQLFNMQIGEVAPGGVGSGLYGMLIMAILTVFIAGLMVGRTPEYLGKKIRPREMKLAASYFPVTELLVLVGTGVAMGLPGPRAGMANTGPHGLSEVLYAFHIGVQQQRLRFRRPVGEHHVLQHGAGSRDGHCPIPADNPGLGAGRITCAPGTYTRITRHFTHPPAAVHRSGRGSDSHPVRSDLPAGPGARALR